MPREAHPHNYSARVTSKQNERLAAIKKVYKASPSAIATDLLGMVADCGAENYHLFQKEVASIWNRLRTS